MTIKKIMKTMTTTGMIRQDDAPQHTVWQWLSHRFRAMNTDIHVSLAAAAPRSLLRIVEESFHYFEQLLSRFRPDSELSHLNECQRPEFQASPDFYAAVEAALWAAQQTGGLYDPAILSFLEEAGYDRTFGAIANPRPLLERDIIPDRAAAAASSASDRPMPAGTYRLFGLDPFTLTVTRPPGTRIDLGGMGKGWTVDRVADSLCSKGHFLLNAGGDLYAFGTPGTERGWSVDLAHPYKQGFNYASLIVDHHAVATSTIARRRWVKNGVPQHHLIDPRTGHPAQTDAISISVVAARVFTAEIFAKAALILGIEAGLAFLDALPHVEGAMFSNSQEVHLTNGMERYLERVDSVGYPKA